MEIVALLSGGQDSITSVAAVLFQNTRIDKVHCITMDYGQMHVVEIKSAKKAVEFIQKHFGVKVEHKIINLKEIFGNIGHSALLTHEKVTQEDGKLPTSFVPGRNMIFLSIACGYAAARKINTVVTGVCETDFSGYPDCRDVFIKSMQETANKAIESAEYPLIRIQTPLMYIDKAETFSLARKISPSLLDFVVNETHTCYMGNTDKNEWGQGCGKCPACEIREAGYEKFKAKFSL